MILHLSTGIATAQEKRELLEEINFMAAVGDHPNVVRLIGACTRGGNQNFNY